jgi:hypothetical protein
MANKKTDSSAAVTQRLWLGVLAAALTFGVVLSGCTTIDTISKENQGTFQNITVPAKDFQSLGLVFTEVTFDMDAKGSRGDVFTYNALLKEAKKLGADYIVNMVIDVKREGSNQWLKIFGIKKDLGLVQGKEIWYGSATAIKYTDSLHTVDTTVITDKATTTTKAMPVMNGNGGGGNNNPLLGGSTKKWWNPLTWFKK